MPPAFVHLRVHTEYSLVNGVVRVKPLVNACAKAGMPAVAVTDQCNLFAMVKFYTAALAAGVTPLVGVDIWLHTAAAHKQPTHHKQKKQDHNKNLNLARRGARGGGAGRGRGGPGRRGGGRRGAGAG